MRSSIIETRSEDYITTARAKGLTDGRILRAHAFPNALLPMVTLIAINLGYVIAGAITAEVVFNWPGLGTLTVDALESRDYPVLQGIFLLLAVSVVAGQPRRRPHLRLPRPAGADVSAAHRAPPARGLRARALAPAPAPDARAFGRRFAGRTDGVIGLAILILFAILAIAPELFVGPLQTATTATGDPLEPPSAAHICSAPTSSAATSST